MQTRFSTANGRKFTQMGIGKGISAGKQEICMKTGGETGLHRVFLLFPVFLLSQGERMVVGTRRVGRTRPTRWGKGKPILNVECGMSNGEVERARGGGLKRPISTANGRERGPRRGISAAQATGNMPVLLLDRRGAGRAARRGLARIVNRPGWRFGGSNRSEPRPPNSSPPHPRRGTLSREA